MTLKELIQRLLRHGRLITGVTAGILLAVALWTFLSAPLYESTGVVRIREETSGLGLAEQLSDVPGLDVMGLGRDELATEMGVLRSWRMAEAVVDSTALMIRMRRPAGIRSEIIEVVAQGDPNWEGRVTLRSRGQGQGVYEATAKERDRAEQSLGRVQAGEEIRFGGYVLVLRSPEEREAPARILLHIVPHYEAVEELREDLDIRRGEGGSRLVEVSYRTPDREMAAAVVNGIVHEFIAYKTGSESAEARYTADELRIQVADYTVRLAKAEERLRDYQELHLIVAPEEEATQQVRRFAELQLQNDALEVERTALGELLALVESRAGEDATLAPDAAAYRQLATYPSFISNSGIQDILLAIYDLETERSELRSRRTEKNLDLRLLTERIGDLEGQLHALAVSYLESLDGQLSSVGTAMDGVMSDLEGLPEREMEYLRLFRERTVLNEAYLLLERQLRLTEVQDAIRGEGVRIVDAGLISHPDDPEFPKPLVNLFLGLILGMAVGMTAALGKDLWET